VSKSRSTAGAESLEHAYVGFGSNLGAGAVNFAAAVRELVARGFEILRQSPLYLSEPWGGAEGGNYTNAVLEIRRRGTPHDFLVELLAVETVLGRTREYLYAPRRCDLDLLFWNSATVNEPDLVVPHPRLAERNFVLIPLCDLIPDAVHPVLGRTLAELLAASPDPLAVWPSQPLHIPPRA
jgi:2-amino-4-hydroxy-6-hydroxymethyldihydropteridine diphosphokinase